MWWLPQLSCFKINEVRRETNKSAYPTPSNKTTCTPAVAEASPPPASRHSRGAAFARGARGGLSGTRAPPDTGRRDTRPEPRRAPDSLKGINSTTLNSITEPRRAPRRAQGAITAPERWCPLPGPGDPDSDPPSGRKGAHRLQNPARGGEGEEEAGPPHSSPGASAGVAPSRLTAEGTETQGPRPPPS